MNQRITSRLAAPFLTLPLLTALGCSHDTQSEARGTVSQNFVAATQVFINEIHYDNAGTDEGEFVEIAAPSGTDLSSYSLVFYNGVNGQQYAVLVLSGIVADQGNSFGTAAFAFPSNGIQNGAPDGVALVGGDGVVLFLSYEGTFDAVDGPAAGMTSTNIGVSESGNAPTGASLQLSGRGQVYADFSWMPPGNATAGLPNTGQSFAAGGDGGGDGDGDGGNCGDAATLISAVQGNSDATPLQGQSVTVEGIVVGDFQGGGENWGGFFLQSLSPDADRKTSEGLLVYDESIGAEVGLGDLVRVSGIAEEYFGMTQIDARSVALCGTGDLPATTIVELPASDSSQLEAVEGMLVQLNSLTVTESYNLGRYGELSLAAGGRLTSPTNDGVSTTDDNQGRRILLDDGRDTQNVEPVAYLGEDGTIRIGDTLASITAVMHYAFDEYRLQPLDRNEVVFTRANPRTASPDPVGGNLKIASLNVLNYFITLNERGANTAQELERQRAKLVSAVVGLDADVLGLMEIENTPEAMDDFVASINAVLGDDIYQKAFDPSFTGTDVIRSAIIYKQAVVAPLEIALSDDAEVHSRPPIAQAFSYQGNVFSVVVNHFKSKGSCPSSAADENADHGQGCWNPLRTQQAAALIEFIATLQEATNDPDVVVLGDLNSYLMEDPIVLLESSGLVNWAHSIPEESRYSYVFSGESGVLDYAMTTESLKVEGATIWHINADEPLILDYNTEYNPAGLYFQDAYRASDHDPFLLGLDLPADPEVLADELMRLTTSVAAEAGWGTVRTLSLTLRLSAVSALLSLELNSLPDPERAKAKRNQAVLFPLDKYQDVVSRYLKQGHLSAGQAELLLEGAQSLATSLAP